VALSPARMIRYGAVALDIAFAPVGGAIVGHLLDLYFHTDPYLTLVMFLLGVGGGFYRLIRMLSQDRNEI
jgi:F0F1-type ATP synthase assembly protein I